MKHGKELKRFLKEENNRTVLNKKVKILTRRDFQKDHNLRLG